MNSTDCAMRAAQHLAAQNDWSCEQLAQVMLSLCKLAHAEGVADGLGQTQAALEAHNAICKAKQEP